MSDFYLSARSVCRVCDRLALAIRRIARSEQRADRPRELIQLLTTPASTGSV